MTWIATSEKDTANAALEKRLSRLNLAIRNFRTDYARN